MAGNVSRAIEGAEAGFVAEVRNKGLLVTLLIPIDNFCFAVLLVEGSYGA